MAERNFTVIENEWITLEDGTRLAARIWMPEGTEQKPVPAVLEYLPYRKRDGTCARDESTYPAFAAAGIAGVRVDIRGSGESEGVIDGEYTPRELSDGCEIIEWIAAQPWSNGKVGMMGISWGGFNCLQVAALKPPALKAVISIASTVDRYNDDIHYKNGCHLSAQLSWAATMLPTSPDRPTRNSSASAGGRCGWSASRTSPSSWRNGWTPAPRRFLAAWLDLRGFRRLSDPRAGDRRLGGRLPQHADQGGRGARRQVQGAHRPVGPQISAFRLAEAASRLSRRGDPLVEPLASRRKERCRAIAADARLYPRRSEARGQAQ